MKSQFSSNGANCIDVARLGDSIYIRETDRALDPVGFTVLTDVTNFTHFVAAVKAGQFDEFCDTFKLADLADNTPTHPTIEEQTRNYTSRCQANSNQVIWDELPMPENT